MMSLTRTVPEEVPSLFHSSLPCVPSSAAKNTVPFTLVSALGEEPNGPGKISWTSDVDGVIRYSSCSTSRRLRADSLSLRCADCLHPRNHRLTHVIVDLHDWQGQGNSLR